MVQDEDTVIYLKLFTILYADDTVIFAESRQELQTAFHGMHHFCTLWKLDINSDKTKVVVFGSKNSNHEPDFTLGGHKITVVSEYVYLGICFPCNNNLGKSIVSLRKQATRAVRIDNKATRSPEISREQVQKLTPQFLLYIYIGYIFPLSLIYYLGKPPSS